MTIVKTKYTLETHKEFFRFLFYRGKYYRFKRVSFSVLGILLIMLWLVFYFIIPCGFPAPLLLAAGIIILLWAHLVPIMLSKQNIKEASGLSQTELSIVFNESNIFVLSGKDDGDSNSELRYEKLYKIYETRNDFYVFITYEHAFIVLKKDLTSGALEDLRTLFRAKMDKDFVICK